MSDIPLTDSNGLAFRLRAISEDQRYTWNEWSEGVLRQSAARIEELEREKARLEANENAMNDQICAMASELSQVFRLIGIIERDFGALENYVNQSNADKKRLDWLADKDNHIGNVQLPREIVLRNLTDMRKAIDEAMALGAS